STRPTNAAVGNAPPSTNNNIRQSVIITRSSPGPNIPSTNSVTNHNTNGTMASRAGTTRAAVLTNSGVVTTANNTVIENGAPHHAGSTNPSKRNGRKNRSTS